MFQYNKTSKNTKGVIASTVLLISSIFPSISCASPIYAPDLLIGSANIISGDATELAQLQTFATSIGETGTLVLNDKVNTPNPSLVAFDNNGNWYIDMGIQTPGYFMLKFGTGQTGQHSHYFFKNLTDMTKLVWTNAQVNYLTGGGNCYAPGFPPGNNPNGPNLDSCNIANLSHYLITNPDTDVPGNEELPEPGTAALAGLGMLGLWLSRRRIRK